jgi:dihydrofolate reductase
LAQSSNFLANDNKEKLQYYPSKIGIIAAVSNNHVIGVNGQLPWRIPPDYQYFRDVTRHKIIIIGRISFEESPTQSHLNHARHVIVVSPSYYNSNCHAKNVIIENSQVNVHIAISLNDALSKAHELLLPQQASDVSGVDSQTIITQHQSRSKSDDTPASAYSQFGPPTLIDCWIAGGEKIFEQALIHPSIHEMRLTHVDLDVDEQGLTAEESQSIAKFPAPYRWDYRFKEIATWKGDGTGICKATKKNDVEYSFHVYECFRPR